MLTQPMFRLALLSAAFSLSILGLQAQNDCNCNQSPILQVKSKCYFVLSKADLGITKCTDSYIVVQDGKTKNRDTIDAPGVFDYNLYSKDGRLLCIGKVNAVGAYGPQLDSVKFSKDTLPFTTNLDDLICHSVGLPGTFASPKSCFLLRYTADGKVAESEFTTDPVPNLGFAFFSMGCHAITQCGINVRIDDRIEYPDCKTSLQSGLFATIKRTWLARACINQPETPFATQYIPIRRPTKKDLQWSIPVFKAKELTVQYGDCTLDKSQIPFESIIPVVGKDQAKMNGQVLGLNLSYALSEKIDTVCDKTGLKLRRTYLIYDECKDQIIDTFIVNFVPGVYLPPHGIKPGDYQNPIKELQNSSPFDSQTEKQRIPDIKVFPNPSQDQVYISLPASWAPQGKIVLKDLQGRVLKRQEINASVITFDLGDQVSNGVHLLEVQSQNQVWTRRLVVLKP